MPRDARTDGRTDGRDRIFNMRRLGEFGRMFMPLCWDFEKNIHLLQNEFLAEMGILSRSHKTGKGVPNEC